jgi:hypothetical protein
MARRKRTSRSPSKRRFSASQVVFYLLSLLIVLSMAIGFVISVLPTPTRHQIVVTPTPIILVTDTPTATPTPEPGASPTVEETPAGGEATPQSSQ